MYKKGICLSDQHIPFQDTKANKLVFKFLRDFQPNYIDILGDLIDFWQISKFLTNPNRRYDLQKDIDRGRAYLTGLRNLCPNSEITLHYGNHLDRLRKYIWNKAKEISSLKGLDLKVPVMLNTENLNIRTIEKTEGFDRRGTLCLTHGTIVSQDSAMTARRNLQKYGLSVICAHTHRLGSTFKTDLRGIIGAWENGCLCDIELIKQWGGELANWQLGFSICYFSGNRFQVDQVPIIKDKILYGGQEITL